MLNILTYLGVKPTKSMSYTSQSTNVIQVFNGNAIISILKKIFLSRGANVMCSKNYTVFTKPILILKG